MGFHPFRNTVMPRLCRQASSVWCHLLFYQINQLRCLES